MTPPDSEASSFNNPVRVIEMLLHEVLLDKDHHQDSGQIATGTRGQKGGTLRARLRARTVLVSANTVKSWTHKKMLMGKRRT